MKSLAIIFAIMAVVVAVLWYQMRAAMTAPFVSTKPSLGTPTTADPPLMTTIVNDLKLGTTIATTAASAAGAIGIGGGTAAAATATTTATAAATGLSTAPVVASAPTSVGGAIGIGAVGTIALIALPIGIFLLAGYFGQPCPQTPEVYAAFQRALAACGNQNPGYYGYDVGNWMSYKGPGYTLLLQHGGSWKAMTEAQLASFLAWHDDYGRVVPESVKNYARAKWCWSRNPDAIYADANVILDC